MNALCESWETAALDRDRCVRESYDNGGTEAYRQAWVREAETFRRCARELRTAGDEARALLAISDRAVVATIPAGTLCEHCTEGRDCPVCGRRAVL